MNEPPRAGRPAATRLLATGLTLCSALSGLACGAPSAEDLVRELIAQRNEYEVRLTSWNVRDDAGVQPSLYLDVLVINDSQESLATLTVMVEQLDAQDQLLGSGRVAIDVAALTPGIPQAIGVDVRPAYPGVEGIRLYIEADPPREAWSEFPEFEAVRPRI